MLGGFWDAVTGKLTERWASVLAPAVVFWAGGLLTWAYAGRGWSRLPAITSWLNHQTGTAQIAVLVGALVVAAASALIVQRLTTPVLRILEGYWPGYLRRLAGKRRQQAVRRKRDDETAWKQLKRDTEGIEPTADQRARLARLEERRRRRPVRDSEMLPTRIGNILRAVETRPSHRYGLDAVIVWPRLWLVLPDTARQELAAARSSVDSSVAAAIWGAGFVSFTWLAWWAAPAGLLTVISAVAWWVPARTEVFADLVEGAYDLYRSSLYQQLRWPLPENPAAERDIGTQVTEYLLRGSDKPDPTFTPPA